MDPNFTPYPLYSSKPDVIVLGTGTGGSLMGTIKYLKEKWPDIKVILEPEEISSNVRG